MHIRFATLADVPAMLAISNWAAEHTPANFAIEPESLQSWEDSFNQTSEKYPWLVACNGEDLQTREVIGFAKASPHRSRCAYAWTAETTIYIDHRHHGKRIGNALYGKLIPMLEAQGFITLLAGITLPNPASQRLHESFGFEHIGTYFKVGWKFGRWHDVGYWERILRNGDNPPGALRMPAEVATSFGLRTTENS